MKILSKFDFLGPKIQMGHEGKVYTVSKIPLIFSLIYILLVIMSIFYFSRTIIWRKNPNTNYYEEYIETTDSFLVNSSTFVHYITMNTLEFPDPIGFDFSSFRVIGIQLNLNIYTKYHNKSLEKMDHWLYGPCDPDNDISDNQTEYFKQIIENSACIKKYYSYSDKKYYDKNDTNFRWPNITYGDNLKKNEFYSIIIEKCEENTLSLILGEGKHCKSDLEIQNTVDRGVWIIFSFLDHFVNLLDYDNPKNIYWYSMENIIKNEYMLVNHLTFNPLTISRNEGFVFDKYEKTIYYEYDSNDLFSHHEQPQNYDLYINYIISLNNKMKYYERRYNKIQDIISEIGGFAGIINTIFVFLLSFYNEYIILNDTKKLIKRLYTGEKEKEINKKDNKNINNIENNQTFANLNLKIYNNNDNIKPELNHIDKLEKQNDNIQNLETKQTDNEDNKDNDPNSVFIEENMHFNFFSYLIHLITFEIKYPKYTIFSDFRNKVLSDEQIIKNNILLFNIVNRSKHNTKIYNFKEILNND